MRNLLFARLISYMILVFSFTRQGTLFLAASSTHNFTLSPSSNFGSRESEQTVRTPTEERGGGGPRRGPVSGGAPSGEELMKEAREIWKSEGGNGIRQWVEENPQQRMETSREVLVLLLEDRNPDVRKEVLYTMMSLGEAIPEFTQQEGLIERMLPRLGDREGIVRLAAVDAVGAMVGSNRGWAQERLLEKVLPLLEDEIIDIRESAVDVIELIVKANLVLAPKALLKIILTRPGNDNVRWAAINKIVKTVKSDRELVQEINQLFSNRLREERDPVIRDDIELLLERFVERIMHKNQVTPTSLTPAWNFEEALEKLRSGTEDEQYEDERYDATQRMVQLVQEQPERKYEVMSLVRNTDEKESVRWRGAVVLGTVQGDSTVLDLLEEAAANSQEKLSVRQAAAQSLGYLGQARSIPVLQPIIVEAERALTRNPRHIGWMRLKRLAKGAIEMIRQIQATAIRVAPSRVAPSDEGDEDDEGDGGGGGFGPSRAVFRPTLDGIEGTGGPRRGAVSGGAPSGEEGPPAIRQAESIDERLPPERTPSIVENLPQHMERFVEGAL